MPPTKATLAVHHDDLAVHAAKHFGRRPKQPRPGSNTCMRTPASESVADETLRQVGRAPAVDRHVHLHAAPRGGHQRLVQLQTDLVLEQDEGLQHHLVLRHRDAREHAREELLAVLEQL